MHIRQRDQRAEDPPVVRVPDRSGNTFAPFLSLCVPLFARLFLSVDYHLAILMTQRIFDADPWFNDL